MQTPRTRRAAPETLRSFAPHLALALSYRVKDYAGKRWRWQVGASALHLDRPLSPPTREDWVRGPPYFAFQGIIVCFDTPCYRPTSYALRPTSTCFSASMICACV
jgi:hypothetical protein